MCVPKQSESSVCANPFCITAVEAGSSPSAQGMLNPSKIYVKPLQFDILCGKSKRCVDHDGSRRFRAVIECHRELYQQALTKFDKTSVTRNIYDVLCQAGSRFLKRDEKLEAWEEISPMAARDKIGHALRFANRVSRKKSSQKPAESVAATVSNSLGSSSTSVESSIAIGAALHDDCAFMQLPFPDLDLEPIPIQALSSSQPAAPWPTALSSQGGSLLGSNQTVQNASSCCIIEPTPLEELITRQTTLLPSTLAFLKSAPETPCSKPVASAAFLPTTLHESFALMNASFMESAGTAAPNHSGGQLFFGQGNLPAEFDFDT